MGKLSFNEKSRRRPWKLITHWDLVMGWLWRHRRIDRRANLSLLLRSIERCTCVQRNSQAKRTERGRERRYNGASWEGGSQVELERGRVKKSRKLACLVLLLLFIQTTLRLCEDSSSKNIGSNRLWWGKKKQKIKPLFLDLLRIAEKQFLELKGESCFFFFFFNFSKSCSQNKFFEKKDKIILRLEPKIKLTSVIKKIQFLSMKKIEKIEWKSQFSSRKRKFYKNGKEKNSIVWKWKL